MSEDDDIAEPVTRLFEAPLGPGHPLGSKYVVGVRIGAGTMGVVHEASSIDGQTLAVKLLRPELALDPKTLSRFLQERHIFRRIDHPNVSRVHDLVVEGDQLAIVMERVSGGDLRQRLTEGPLVPSRAVALAADVAAGLSTIHRAAVVHRDLKPANILLTEDLQPKISDFGVSRIVSGALSRTATMIGTPRYMAPEAADGRGAEAPADVYALGAILFETLVGRAPFSSGGTFAVLRAHAAEPPPRVEGVPSELADLIDRMLAKGPGARPSPDRVEYELRTLLPRLDDGSVPTAGPPTAREATATDPMGPTDAAGPEIAVPDSVDADPVDLDPVGPGPMGPMDPMDPSDAPIDATAILPDQAVMTSSARARTATTSRPATRTVTTAGRGATAAEPEAGLSQRLRRSAEAAAVAALMVMALGTGAIFLARAGGEPDPTGSDTGSAASPEIIRSSTTSSTTTPPTLAPREPSPSTTIAPPTTVVPSTTTSSTAGPEIAATGRIRILDGPTINELEPRAFQFSYTTNEVCGSGNFLVREKRSERLVGTFLGEEGCYGPTHGGYPGLPASEVFRVFELEPSTTYVVEVVARGTDSDGTMPGGVGRVSRAFEVTTTAE